MWFKSPDNVSDTVSDPNNSIKVNNLIRDIFVPFFQVTYVSRKDSLYRKHNIDP
jgi:hypothetical protein